jgi:predicted dehydrogenase
MKVGVIGIGSMGKHHVRIYSEMPDVELVGISDINKNKSMEIGEKFGTKFYDDYRELLKQDLDAVSIAVPTTLHKKVAIDAFDAGLNVLVEKPISDTVRNATAMIKKAEKENLKLMVGHIERFNPIIDVIKKTAEPSDVISIDITRVGPLPPRVKDVGVLIDLGVHDIDLIRYLSASEFKDVYALVTSSLAHLDDTAIMIFKMENGILAHITTNWLTPFKVREIRISTAQKFITGDFMTQKVVEYSKYKEDASYVVKDLFVPYGEPLRLELEAFIRCIKNDTDAPVTGYDGLIALEVALMGLKSAVGGTR